MQDKAAHKPIVVAARSANSEGHGLLLAIQSRNATSKPRFVSKMPNLRGMVDVVMRRAQE